MAATKRVIENKAASTPGPWRYQEQSDAYTHIVRGPGNLFITQLRQDASGQAEAYARLIAAAPDLLAVAKGSLAEHERELEVIIDCNGDDPLADPDIARLKDLIRRTKAAIRKAEGKGWNRH